MIFGRMRDGSRREGEVSRRRATMVQHQLMGRGIRDQRALAAMGSVRRELFVPEGLAGRAYEDGALPIGEGQTISQPYMVARTCELARLEGDEHVLEVGAGSGYQAAVLGRLARTVISIEYVAALAGRARKALEASGLSNVEVVVGDGSLGHPARAPYDRIVVAAAAPAVPEALLEQLAEGGRLVIPVGPRVAQRLRVVENREGRLVESEHDGCVFVPLVGEQGFG